MRAFLCAVRGLHRSCTTLPPKLPGTCASDGPASPITDIIDVLRCIRDAYAPEGGPLAVHISEAAVPSVAMPRGVLEAALVGLIDNSMQAGAARVMIAVRPALPCVRVVVTDDGQGVPAGDRHRIFEPLFTTHRADGGTGLGLPILRSLLDPHRGSIVFDASARTGASFVISLPAAH